MTYVNISFVYTPITEATIWLELLDRLGDKNSIRLEFQLAYHTFSGVSLIRGLVAMLELAVFLLRQQLNTAIVYIVEDQYNCPPIAI